MLAFQSQHKHTDETFGHLNTQRSSHKHAVSRQKTESFQSFLHDNDWHWLYIILFIKHQLNKYIHEIVILIFKLRKKIAKK